MLKTFTIINKRTKEKEVHEAITQVIFEEHFLSAEMRLIDINGYCSGYKFTAEDLDSVQIKVNSKTYSLSEFRYKYKEDEEEKELKEKQEKEKREASNRYWRERREAAEQRAYERAYHDTGWPEDDRKEAMKNMWRYYRLSDD